MSPKSKKALALCFTALGGGRNVSAAACKSMGRQQSRRNERGRTAGLPVQSAWLRPAHHQFRRRQHIVENHGEGPADRRERKRHVGQGIRRRSRLDQAGRVLDSVYGPAARLEEASPRRRLRRRDGRLPSALHLQSQPASRLHRYAAARLCAAQICRSHAPRRHHRHCGLERFKGADSRDFRRRDRLAALEAPGV